MNEALESFRRVRSGDFASHFYERFLAADPRVRALFRRTDFKLQKHMLLHGIQMLLEYGSGQPVGTMAIERLGRRHSAGELGVSGEMYDVWLRCLFATLAALDTQWSPSIERAWRRALEPGLTLMRRHAAGAA